MLIWELWLSISVGQDDLNFNMCYKMFQESNKVCVSHPSWGMCFITASWAISYEMWLEINCGNTNIGGLEFPLAFTANSKVVNWPLSPDVNAPFCLTPLCIIIFWRPLHCFNSSFIKIININIAWKAWQSITFDSLSKNKLTVVALKGSGQAHGFWCSDREYWILQNKTRKPIFTRWGNFTLNLAAHW